MSRGAAAKPCVQRHPMRGGTAWSHHQRIRQVAYVFRKLQPNEFDAAYSIVRSAVEWLLEKRNQAVASAASKARLPRPSLERRELPAIRSGPTWGRSLFDDTRTELLERASPGGGICVARDHGFGAGIQGAEARSAHSGGSGKALVCGGSDASVSRLPSWLGFPSPLLRIGRVRSGSPKGCRFPGSQY